MNHNPIQGLVCKLCQKAFYPPVYTCDQCGSESFQETLFSGEGKILTFSKVLRAGPKDKTPYVLAVIELKEGARISTRIENFEIKEPDIGENVSATGRYHNETPIFKIV